MKILQISILIICALLLNIVAFILYLFHINSLWDILTITIYLSSIIGVIFYLYFTITDIVKLHTLKGVLSNDTLLTTVCTITTNLLFKYKNQSIVDLLSNITEQRFIVKILLNYVPLTNLLVDHSLVICMNNDDKNTYSSILKTKISEHISAITVPYKNVYVLLAINILSLPFFYYLLS